MRFLLSILTSAFFVSCGAVTSTSSTASLSAGNSVISTPKFEASQLNNSETGTLEDLSNVSFTLSGTPTITPGTPPATGEVTTSFVISFNVVVDRTADQTFTYNKNKWLLGFQLYNETGTVLELTTAPTVAGTDAVSGTSSTVSVTLTASLPSGLPVDVMSMLNTSESSGRRQVKAVAIYRDGSAASSSDRQVKMLWAANLGAIVSGPTITNPTTSDQTLVARWAPPSDLSAVMRSNGTLASAGTSSVSGYLLVYWNIDTCGAANAQWAWNSNSEIDASGSSRQLGTCLFAASGAAQYSATTGTTTCSLGCGVDASATYSGKAEDDVAVPTYIPSSSEAGTVFSVGCYNVVRVAAHNAADGASFSLPDLANGQRYGMMVYTLDSAGHVSLGRSACAFGQPIPVPLPGDGKSGGASKTRSDCFVATAASGSANSRSVHYWRIVRDTILLNSRFVDWYYQNGPSMASWLDRHSELKPAVNFVLENTGHSLVNLRLAYKHALQWITQTASSSVNALSHIENFFVSKAEASEANSTEIESSESEARNLNSDPFLLPVSAYFSFQAGKVNMTTDKATWDAYFRDDTKAKSLYGYSGTFGYSLWGGSYGELSVSATGTYFGATGKVPNVLPDGSSVDSRVAGTDHVATTLMGVVGADVRLRVPNPYLSWFAPRVAYSFGYARLRLEPRADSALSTQNTDAWPVGYTLKKQMTVLRYGGEILIGRLFPQSIYEMRSSLGVVDMGFNIFAENWQDHSNSLSLNSQVWGGGLTFLLQ